MKRTLLPALLGLAPALAAGAGLRLSQPAALAKAFPGAELERRTAYLSEERRRAVARAAQAPMEESVVAYYVARAGGAVAGYAFFDTHVVRTQSETVMVALDAGGRLKDVEVLAFYEPEDYLPRDSWLARFRGLLAPETRLGRGVDGVSGATLTSLAVTEAARRALALHEELSPPSPQGGRGHEAPEARR